MLAYFDLSISWFELAKRTIRDTIDDNGPGLAAQLAYYFLLALFPALLFLIALASHFPLVALTPEVVSWLGPVLPGQVIELLRAQMIRLSEGEHSGLLSLGLLGALWSSSAALVAVVSALNRAYDINEGRAWWKVRLVAIFLTVELSLFIMGSLALVMAGPQLADLLASHLGYGAAFQWAWKVVQWPIVFLLVAVGIELVYHFAPDAEQEWVWITPGSLVATILWLIGSIGFRFYIVNFGNYEATYGTLGAVIALLLWFYLSALAIIVGLEMNAEIERARPWTEDERRRGPGEKKRIGPAAARAHGLATGRVRAAG